MNDLAGIYYENGKRTEAEAMWRQAIPEFRRADEDEGLGASSNNLGESYLASGRLRQADQLLHQAILSYQRINDTDGLGRRLSISVISVCIATNCLRSRVLPALASECRFER